MWRVVSVGSGYDIVTYRIEVHFDAADVGSTNWDHAEETVSPSSEKSHSLVQHEQVGEPFHNVRGYREEFTWIEARQLSSRTTGQPNPPAKCLLRSTTQAVGLWNRW